MPWLRLAGSRQVWLLMWQYFCFSYGWYFYITWLPSYLQRGRHLPLDSAKWLAVLPLFFGGLGSLAGHYAAARLARSGGGVARARRRVASIGFIAGAGFLLLSTRIESPLLAVLAIGVSSFSNDLSMPCSWAAAMDIGGPCAGTLSGAMNMWGNMGGAIAATVNGYLLRWFHGNWNIGFYVSATIYLVAPGPRHASEPPGRAQGDTARFVKQLTCPRRIMPGPSEKRGPDRSPLNRNTVQFKRGTGIPTRFPDRRISGLDLLDRR